MIDADDVIVDRTASFWWQMVGRSRATRPPAEDVSPPGGRVVPFEFPPLVERAFVQAARAYKKAVGLNKDGRHDEASRAYERARWYSDEAWRALDDEGGLV